MSKTNGRLKINMDETILAFKKMYKKLLLMGLLSALFGCNNRETIDPEKSKHYVKDNETGEVFYKYYLGGNLVASYGTLDTQYPDDLVVLGTYYATDGHKVFYTYHTLENANPKGFHIHPEFSDAFAKDSISKTHYYRNNVLNLDYQSAKIHSYQYVSDKNKVLYNQGNLYRDKVFDLEVPVQDPPGFELIQKKKCENCPDPLSNDMTVVAKDKFWYYFNAVRLPLTSDDPLSIIHLTWPSIFLYQDNLHYIDTSPFNYIQHKMTVPDNLSKEYIGTIESKRDTYHHLKIGGFKKAQQIEASSWLKDNNGLYYIERNLGTLLKISGQQYKTYDTHTVYHQNYLRTEDSLFAVYGHAKSARFSASAEILDEDIVNDQQTIYYKGDKVEDVDVATFVKFEKDFIDKNYFYYNYKPNSNRFPIPHWAYDELINGNIEWDDFSDIKMGYDHTSYKEYWNGFLVTMNVPTKRNPDRKLQIVFKNIERKTLQLDRPLEETLHLLYRKEYKDGNELSERLIPTTPYNHQEIEPEKIIEFMLELSTEVTDTKGEVFTYPYFIALSSSNQTTPERTDYHHLYIESKVELTEQSPER